MRRLLALLICSLVVACGGGSTPPPNAPEAAAPAATLSGLAATGTAISGRVSLKDAVGHEHHVDTTDGRFSFSLEGLTAPLVLKAEWTSSGTTQTLYSFAPTAAGGTVNITPLTHLALVAAAGGTPLADVFAGASPQALADLAAALPGALAQMQQALAPLLAQHGVAGADPFADGFAADHTGMDALLDGIAVGYAGGTVSVVDRASGAVVVEAPQGDLAHATVMPPWSAAEAAAALDPEVAVDAGGRGLVVWTEFVGGHTMVRARWLAAGAAAVTISTGGDASLPRLAFDAAGNAMIVWAQYDGTRSDVWAARFLRASASFGAPVRVSAVPAGAYAQTPDVASDAAGAAWVVWTQGDGRPNHYDIGSARYAPAGDAWSAPVLLNDTAFSAHGARVAMNAAGQGVVAWAQQRTDGTQVSNGVSDIWARDLQADGSVLTAVRLNAVSPTPSLAWINGQLAVAVDGTGNALAIWSQDVIHGARRAGGVWAASAVIASTATAACYSPQLAIDAAGHAVAVWRQLDDQGGAAVGTSRFDPASGWGAPVALGNDGVSDVEDPHVALDGAGNATAVWYRWGSGGLDVMISRSPGASPWSAPRVQAATPTDGFTYPQPRVAAGAGGPTLVVWGTGSN